MIASMSRWDPGFQCFLMLTPHVDQNDPVVVQVVQHMCSTSQKQLGLVGVALVCRPGMSVHTGDPAHQTGGAELKTGRCEGGGSGLTVPLKVCHRTCRPFLMCRMCATNSAQHVGSNCDAPKEVANMCIPLPMVHQCSAFSRFLCWSCRWSQEQQSRHPATWPSVQRGEQPAFVFPISILFRQKLHDSRLLPKKTSLKSPIHPSMPRAARGMQPVAPAHLFFRTSPLRTDLNRLAMAHRYTISHAGERPRRLGWPHRGPPRPTRSHRLRKDLPSKGLDLSQGSWPTSVSVRWLGSRG